MGAKGSINRIRRILREAEGYLELQMPGHASDALDRVQEPGTFRAQVQYLRGEALRSQRRYREAIDPLEDAADLAPSNLSAWIALAWCYKRAGQLRLAIEALKNALEIHPGEPILHYNLACYWSLTGHVERAVGYLARAFDLDESFRDLAAEEPDFNPIRETPEYQALVSVIV